MDIQDLIARFRSQVDDEQSPYLWDDPEVLEYVVDAQDMLVRAMGGFADVTVPAGDASLLTTPPTRLQDLALTPNDPYTAMSPYILRTRSARLLTAAWDVRIINEADLPFITNSSATWDYGWTKGLRMDDTDTGDVKFGMLGVRENQVRWFRIPVAADTCRLHFYRLPYPRITSESSALEVGEEHHIHLVKWMKHMAYSKEDAETYDKTLADRNKAAFEEYCEKAKAELERKRYKPRVVKFNPGYWSGM